MQKCDTAATKSANEHRGTLDVPSVTVLGSPQFYSVVAIFAAFGIGDTPAQPLRKKGEEQEAKYETALCATARINLRHTRFRRIGPISGLNPAVGPGGLR